MLTRRHQVIPDHRQRPFIARIVDDEFVAQLTAPEPEPEPEPASTPAPIAVPLGRVSLIDVAVMVANQTGVPLDALRSPLRGPIRAVAARHLAFYWARAELALSHRQIGLLFNRDCSSVLNGIVAAGRRLESDAEYAGASERVKADIGAMRSRLSDEAARARAAAAVYQA